MKNQNMDYFSWVIRPLFLKGNKNTAPDCSPESYWMMPFRACERKLFIMGEETQMVTLTYGVQQSCGVIDPGSSGTTPAVS